MAVPTRIDRVTLTKTELRATEIALYRTADLLDRLLASGGIPYGKIEVPAGSVPPQNGGQ